MSEITITLSREELECLYSSLCDEGGPSGAFQGQLAEKLEAMLKPYWDADFAASADKRNQQEEEAKARHLASGKTHYEDPTGVPNDVVAKCDELLRIKRIQG